MDWKSQLEKNPIQKIEKGENQSEIAACGRKTTGEKVVLFKQRFLTLL